MLLEAIFFSSDKKKLDKTAAGVYNIWREPISDYLLIRCGTPGTLPEESSALSLYCRREPSSFSDPIGQTGRIRPGAEVTRRRNESVEGAMQGARSHAPNERPQQFNARAVVDSFQERM